MWRWRPAGRARRGGRTPAPAPPAPETGTAGRRPRRGACAGRGGAGRAPACQQAQNRGIGSGQDQLRSLRPGSGHSQSHRPIPKKGQGATSDRSGIRQHRNHQASGRNRRGRFHFTRAYHSEGSRTTLTHDHPAGDERLKAPHRNHSAQAKTINQRRTKFPRASASRFTEEGSIGL